MDLNRLHFNHTSMTTSSYFMLHIPTYHTTLHCITSLFTAILPYHTTATLHHITSLHLCTYSLLHVHRNVPYHISTSYGMPHHTHSHCTKSQLATCAILLYSTLWHSSNHCNTQQANCTSMQVYQLLHHHTDNTPYHVTLFHATWHVFHCTSHHTLLHYDTPKMPF